MKIVSIADAVRYRTMTTEQLRDTFLLGHLFEHGRVDLTYVDLDRTLIGSAVPTDIRLALPNDGFLKSDYFLERRELGVLNVGGSGSVTVGDDEYRLDSLDALYIGCANARVTFSSDNVGKPAEYYLLSYPAHMAYETKLIKSADLSRVDIGSATTANARQITKLIYLDGVRSCQLVMGFTQLATGSVWNTMPPHTHRRRSEVYLYFGLADEQRVIHLMGMPQETRHIVVSNKQAVISPGWSIHAGVGTGSYSFCWGMGGENQVYDDMDGLSIADIL